MLSLLLMLIDRVRFNVIITKKKKKKKKINLYLR